jgi:hypothetical protein
MYVNGKMLCVESVPGLGEGDKGEDGGGVFKYDIYDILLRNFVNAIVYPC